MAFLVLKIAAGAAAIYVFLSFLLHSTQDEKEPQVLESTIPFLSPIIGMRKKGKFYTSIRDHTNLPIYTLRLPFSRLYIVNSTPLIPIIQKQVRTLDFAPIEAKVAINVMGASPNGRKILIRERDDGGKDYSYAIEYSKAIHPAVSPGPMLDAMNRDSLVNVAAAVERLWERGETSLDLFAWVREEIMTATTEAVYGVGNPFRDIAVREAYRKFEPGIIKLLLKFYPDLFARESVQGRKVIVDAFEKYLSSETLEKASGFVKAQYEHKIQQGVTGRDIARFELGAVVAILSNTVPAAFWLLYHAISDAAVLEECRREIMTCCVLEGDCYTLDVTQVKTSCSILLSIFKESLRFHGIGTSVRMVTEDHLLDGKYLLKKGGIVMIPGPVQHSSKSAYGDDVNDFQHRRFVKSPTRSNPDPVAFRAFGGGSTLCPGRHFATTEVLVFVALVVMRFDIEPFGEKWVCPKTERAGMAGTVAPPDEDVEVRVRPRGDELGKKKWVVVLSGSDRGVDVAAEDMQ